MHNRLNEIINYATHGKRKEFADKFGWKASYVGKLLAGNGIGIQPVLAILKAYPEIDARWFLFGEGNMFTSAHNKDLQQMAITHIKKVLELEMFLPVMTPEEMKKYEGMLTSHEDDDFSQAARTRWIAKTAERQMEVELKVSEAMKKSDELCRQETASE